MREVTYFLSSSLYRIYSKINTQIPIILKIFWEIIYNLKMSSSKRNKEDLIIRRNNIEKGET